MVKRILNLAGLVETVLNHGYVLCCWERIFPIGGGSLL